MSSINSIKDKDIVFLGGVFRKDNECEILENSKHIFQTAANVLQWKLIDGMDMLNKKPIKIINAAFIGSYPIYYKTMVIRSKEWSHKKGAMDKEIGFINIFGIKELIRGKYLKNELRKWAKLENAKEKVIFIYSMNTAFLSAAFYAKTINPCISVCLICPDLPGYMNEQGTRGKLFDFLKKLDCKNQKRYIKGVDSFVFLTKYMNEKVNTLKKPWCVVEGISDVKSRLISNEEKYIEQEMNGKRVILYTGTMVKRYGIVDLLDAFLDIKDDKTELWLCGSGLDDDILAKYTNTNSRIKYLGQLNRTNIIMMQEKAYLLINPRKSDKEYVKYSFPSKVIEYMESGTPTLMHNLPGIPDDYRKHFYNIDDYGDLSEALRIVLSIPKTELDHKALGAKRFVLKHKSIQAQVSKIFQMIDGEEVGGDEVGHI